MRIGDISNNFFPLINFISKKQQQKEVAKFSDKLLNIAKKHPRAKISIVGHSFGTYIIYNALLNINEKLELGYLIFSGSVLNPEVDVESIYKKHNLVKILNECTTFDFPLLAGRFVTNTFFTAGITGISGVSDDITNRYIKGGHSSYFKQVIIDEWCPFLLTGTFKEKNETVEGLR